MAGAWIGVTRLHKHIDAWFTFLAFSMRPWIKFVCTLISSQVSPLCRAISAINKWEHFFSVSPVNWRSQ